MKKKFNLIDHLRDLYSELKSDLNEAILVATYFAYYDRIPEPIRSRAKENFIYALNNSNDSFYQPKLVPNSSCATTAIYWGFDWKESNEGVDYWKEVIEQMTDNPEVDNSATFPYIGFVIEFLQKG